MAHKTTAFRLIKILPAHVVDSQFDDIEEAVRLYLPIISENNENMQPDIENLKTDFLRWQIRWQDVLSENQPDDSLRR